MAVLGGAAVEHQVSYSGMIADLQLANKVSKINKNSGIIKAGLAVVSSDDTGADLPTSASTAADFCGVVVRELNNVNALAGGGIDNAARDMSVMTTGVIWVEVVTAVEKDDPVFFVVGDDSADNENLGKFANVVGATVTTAVALPQAKFVSSAEAGKLAKISLVIGG